VRRGGSHSVPVRVSLGDLPESAGSKRLIVSCGHSRHVRVPILVRSSARRQFTTRMLISPMGSDILGSRCVRHHTRQLRLTDGRPPTISAPPTRLSSEST
jgi:hypothetical protein